MDRIEQAFRRVKRENFLPEEIRDQAYFDGPLSIGYGQTNSQPYTVRLMLEWLDAKEGEKVLDVGSGSGWTTALLSHIVGQNGKVYAVERVPELVDFGKKNNDYIGIKNAEFYKAGAHVGLSEHAPYDRILVSASANSLPQKLLGQLKAGGKLVIPVNQDILEISKYANGQMKTVAHPGFVFVPLIENQHG